MALITSDDALLQALALFSWKTAKHHEANTLSLRPTVPGMGKVFSLVLLSDIPHLERVPSGPEVASSCRWVTCSQESGGNRVGPSGNKIGHAHLTGALSEAAPLFWRYTPQGQKLRSRFENTPDTGKALSLLAHTLGRAVDVLLQRQVAFALERFLHTSGSRVGEPGASLDLQGRSL